MAKHEPPDSTSSSAGSESASSEAAPRCPGLVPGCSNFGIQYNYASASIAMAVMLSHQDSTNSGDPDFPEPDWAKFVLLSVPFVGSVVGMLTMGYLGDAIGIKRATVVTHALTVFGALASALLSFGEQNFLWGVISLSRFVLGMGVGGAYPLSAAKAAQAAPASEAVSKAALAFFWQGPGACAPYLLALGLLGLRGTHLVPSRELTSVQFRIILGVGALPALVSMLAALEEDDPGAVDKKGGELEEALKSPRHWRTLFGTAGTWFLFDVAFYGTVIFQLSILKKVFGEHTTLAKIAMRALFLLFIGILGTVTGLALLHHVPARLLGSLGLAAGAALYAAFTVVAQYQPDQHNVLFVLLCLVYFVMYCGPNLATYVLPVVSFPKDVRSTFHGLSAAGAKVGAMTGTFVFPWINKALGVPGVMATQAVVCLAGAILCHCCLESKFVPDDEEPAKAAENDAELVALYELGGDRAALD